VVKDLRYACRSLRHHPAFSVVAIATLAIGIGATTAIFTVADALIRKPLPVQRPEQLVELLIAEPGGQPAEGFTHAMWAAIHDQQHSFAAVFAWSGAQLFDVSRGATTSQIDGEMVSGDFFDALGVGAATGRLLHTSDDQPGCEPIAVLGYDYWRVQYGGAPNAVGASITLNRQPFQIVGVSAPRFFGMEVGRKFDVAVPLCASTLFDKRNTGSRNRWWLNIGARLRSGSTAEQLRPEFEALSPVVMRLAVPNGSPERQARFLATKLAAVPAANGASGLRRRFGRPLQILMIAVVLVLLVACANIASLSIARGAARGRELAVRMALGAGRPRIVRQLLTETLVVCAAGALAGLVLARALAAGLVTALATSSTPVFVELSLDDAVLAFTAVVTVATTLLVGLMPALRATVVSVGATMKGPAAAPSSRGSGRFGTIIVAAQFALCLPLLVGSGLLVRTFVNLTALDTGFDRRNVLVVSARAPWFAADTVSLPPEDRSAAFAAITDRLERLPGVVSVARAFTTPLGDDNWVSQITPIRSGGEARPLRVYLNRVTPGYFATLRTPILAGRDFAMSDTALSPRVAIVNDALARRMFPGQDALGRTFREGDEAASVEIIGVAHDATYESLREDIPPTVYLPATQPPRGSEAQEFVLRTAVDPRAMIPDVERQIRAVTDQLPLRFTTMEGQVADNVVQERLVAMLAGSLGAVALLLSLVGLYGLLNYLVSHQRGEFGIRLALGASPRSIRELVIRRVLLILAWSVPIGVTATSATAGTLRQLLFGLAPRDTATVLVSTAALAVTALLAGYLPARRASRVDPMLVLRNE